MIDRIQAISIPVADQDRAKAFYCDALGFETITDEIQSTGVRWVQLAPKGGETAIILATWLDALPPGSLRGLLLHTPDIATLHAHLTSLGIVPPAITEAPWAKYFRLNDPDGNGLVIQQRPEGYR